MTLKPLTAPKSFGPSFAVLDASITLKNLFLTLSLSTRVVLHFLSEEHTLRSLFPKLLKNYYFVSKDKN